MEDKYKAMTPEERAQLERIFSLVAEMDEETRERYCCYGEGAAMGCKARSA